MWNLSAPLLYKHTRSQIMPTQSSQPADVNAGARVNLLVKEVITNTSGFERSLASDSAVDLTQLMSSAQGQKPASNTECSQRLVIHPRHDSATAAHNCPICPANLCKVMLVNQRE